MHERLAEAMATGSRPPAAPRRARPAALVVAAVVVAAVVPACAGAPDTPMGGAPSTLTAAASSTLPVAAPPPALPPAASSPPQEPILRGGSLLARDEPLFWMVAGRDGAPRCAAFVVRSYAEPNTGTLRPATPQRSTIRARVVGRDGGIVAPPAPDPYRRIGFEFERRGDKLVVHTPRGLVDGQWLVLSRCRATLALDSMPWFATAAACRAAIGEATPTDFGPCREVVPAFPFTAEERRPAWLDRAMQDGGVAFELTHHGDEQRCTAWRFRPRGQPGQGTMRSHQATGGRTTITTYTYDRSGHQLILLGPSHQSFEHGRETGNLAYGCGESYFVRSIDEQHATVGGAHWFATAARCRQATAAPPQPLPEPADDRTCAPR